MRGTLLTDWDGFLNELAAQAVPFDGSVDAIARAAKDASQLRSAPLCVVRPDSVQQIAEAVKLCRKHAVPVAVAGGYTGLSGGALGYEAVRIETRQLDSFRIEDGAVWAQAGASVPEIVRRTEQRGYCFPFQPASACRSEDAYEYLGARVGPVTVGGSLAANASGLVGCKLGAAADWVTELLIIRPDGEFETLTDGFARHVGAEGRYGIIAEARIALAPLPEDLQTHLVSGIGTASFTSAAVAIGHSGALPLLAEGMVMAATPPDFPAIARRTLDDPEAFLDAFASVFASHAWLILLQGDRSDSDACLRAIRDRCPDAAVRPISAAEFVQMKQIRSAASDEIGCGVESRTHAAQLDPPVQRASRFLAEAIREFAARGLQPKAEHNFGMLRPFLEDEQTREAYRREVEAGTAFDDGSLTLHDKCDGDIETLLARCLSPNVTEEMRRRRMAVNFPGNEDILIRAEQFPETVELLGSLMRRHAACPVPLYYCHINFRKRPGWILVHNRLLIDVAEFA
jgi:FAD/FMN-containing dehydrogenase